MCKVVKQSKWWNINILLYFYLECQCHHPKTAGIGHRVWYLELNIFDTMCPLVLTRVDNTKSSERDGPQREPDGIMKGDELQHTQNSEIHFPKFWKMPTLEFSCFTIHSKVQVSKLCTLAKESNVPCRYIWLFGRKEKIMLLGNAQEP